METQAEDGRDQRPLAYPGRILAPAFLDEETSGPWIFKTSSLVKSRRTLEDAKQLPGKAWA